MMKKDAKLSYILKKNDDLYLQWVNFSYFVPSRVVKISKGVIFLVKLVHRIESTTIKNIVIYQVFKKKTKQIHNTQFCVFNL